MVTLWWKVKPCVGMAHRRWVSSRAYISISFDQPSLVFHLLGMRWSGPEETPFNPHFISHRLGRGHGTDTTDILDITNITNMAPMWQSHDTNNTSMGTMLRQPLQNDCGPSRGM